MKEGANPKMDGNKISLSTMLYFRYTLTEAIERIANVGYRNIEIPVSRPHLWPSDATGDYIQTIASCLRTNRISVSSICPGPTWSHLNMASPEENQRKEAIQYINDSVKLAARLGSRIVIMIPGWILYGTSYDDAWNWAVEGTKQCVAVAEEEDVVLVLETLSKLYWPNIILSDINHAIRLIKEVGSKNLRVMIDTCHSTREKESLIDCTKMLGNLLAHVHIRDLDKSNASVPPGKGTLNFRTFLGALRQINYQGYICVELSDASVVDPDAAALESKEFLDRLI